MIKDDPVGFHDQTNPIPRLLTSEETIELARIQKDSAVIGYAIISFEGEEIETSGAWSHLLAPVFANIFDLVDNFGEEFGESDTCPMVIIDSDDFEVAGVLLSSCRAVFIRRKQRRTPDGLRSVG